MRCVSAAGVLEEEGDWGETDEGDEQITLGIRWRLRWHTIASKDRRFLDVMIKVSVFSPTLSLSVTFSQPAAALLTERRMLRQDIWPQP